MNGQAMILSTEVLVFAQSLAAEANNIIKSAHVPEVKEKSPGDWCSDLDRLVEQHLRQRVKDVFPQHGFWGEESNIQPPSMFDTDKPFVWLVDPIDGSMNFLRGYPHYSISIALLQQGVPIVGCVLDPVRDEMFSAQLGQGAFCNGVRLSCASTRSLSQSLAATVFPKPKSAHLPVYLTEFSAVINEVAGLRRSGSMALELAYLASGRVDAFWQRGMGAWDAAAGLLLIKESGGEFWSLDGLEWWQSQATAASGPALRSSWSSLLDGVGDLALL